MKKKTDGQKASEKVIVTPKEHKSDEDENKKTITPRPSPKSELLHFDIDRASHRYIIILSVSLPYAYDGRARDRCHRNVTRRAKRSATVVDRNEHAVRRRNVRLGSWEKRRNRHKTKIKNMFGLTSGDGQDDDDERHGRSVLRSHGQGGVGRQRRE